MLPSLSTAPAPPPVTAHPERFHTNHVTLTGVVQSVWQRYRSAARHAAPPDIMARLAVYDRDAVRRTAAPTRKRPAHYVTLCFPQGATAAGDPISLTANLAIGISGYLRDDPYEQTLSDVLHLLHLSERRLPGDETQRLKRISTHVVVQTLEYLDRALGPDDFDDNTAVLSGVIQRVWERPGRRPLDWQTGDPEPAPDVLARLAFYDSQAETLDPAEHADFRRDPRGQLPMHRAHYVTLRIPNGRTPDGLPIGLQPRSGVRLTGHLVDVAYPESLHQILTWLRLPDRLREDDRERKLQQVLTYVIPRSLVRFGSVPYSQVSA